MTDTAESIVDTDFKLECPTCGADLGADTGFLSWRVCSACGRHFAMPATERVTVLLDEETFRPLRSTTAADETDMQTAAQDRLANARERNILQEAIVTGTGNLHGTTVMVIALDDQLVGGQIGALGAEKIIQALETAESRRLPIVMIVAGGSSTMHLSPLAVVQGARIASTAARVQALGLPMIGIVTHPTSAAVFNSVASLCDIVFAEPGASVGVVWAASRPIDAMDHAVSVDDMLINGWIDGVMPRPEQRDRLGNIISLVSRHSVDITPIETTLPMELDRPLVDFLDVIIAPFTELRGDRVDFDDRGVVTGIGAIDEMPIAIAVQDSRVDTNTSAAIRKVQRIARFAGRFELPLVMIVDGKEPISPYSVSPGESYAAAKMSAMMSVVPIPVVSIGVGTVQGLVSNMMMFGDRRMMVDQSRYRLPGGTTSWQHGGRASDVREWSARECERIGLIDQVIDMPEGGAMADPWLAVRMLRTEIHASLMELSRLGQRRLIERRAHTHRELGHTEEGIASVLGELREWQDVQQSLRDSIDDWKNRLEQRVSVADWRERLEQRPQIASFQRPDLSDIGARFKARQEKLRQELLERTRGERKDNDNE